jgi:hypothetical protein
MRGIGILIDDDYRLRVKPERDGTGKIVAGLMIGATIHQNTGLILICRKGEFKEVPALGVGIEDVLLDNDYLEWRRRIRLNLELDSQVVKDVKFSTVDKLTIDADYNS